MEITCASFLRYFCDGSRSLVRREGTLSEIRRHLKDDDSIGIICVHGAPGSGKTAILRQIYDEFHTGGLFDLAIYVTLSRDGDLWQDLCAAMGLSNDSWRWWRASLSEKRYLLLLGDVRRQLDLTTMGFPPPSAYNKSKITFTTTVDRDPWNRNWDFFFPGLDLDLLSPDRPRKLSERARPSAYPIIGKSILTTSTSPQAIVKLDPLNQDQSWELFRRELGADAVLRDPYIRDLAQQMVDGCGGRPLALVTMGQAMADQRLLIEWQHAAEALKVSEITYQQKKGTNLDTRLFSRLKFSYDYLGDDTLRSCLLYCALFPEGQDIHREQLIEYWIGEGLLDFGERASLYVARNRGHVIIRSLQSAGLLQTGIRDGERFVKLGVAVRDMALWITSGKSGMEGSRFVVEAGKELALEPTVEQWSSATRVSLMQNYIVKLPDKLPRSCSKLLTLLINGRNPQQVQCHELTWRKILRYTGVISVSLPETFFGSFPTLRVLDLSCSQVYRLPSTVSSLCELQYLNLSHTSISSLPTELGKLVKLRQLDLRYTEHLSEVPPQAISGLKALQLLNLYGSSYSEVKLEDLGRLQTLTELGVSLRDLRLFTSLQLHNEKLPRSVRYLKLFRMRGLIFSYLDHAFSVWSRLRELWLDGCNQLEEFTVGSDQLLFLQVLQLEDLADLSTVKLGLGDPKARGAHVSPALRRLSHLCIIGCSKLKQLEWFGHLPRLTEVHVHYCNAMEQLLIGGGSGGEEGQNSKDSLPRLRKLSLQRLSSLGVSGIPLLKSLGPEAMEVEECPMLTPLLQKY